MRLEIISNPCGKLAAIAIMRAVISSTLIQGPAGLGRGYFPKNIAIRAFINFVKSAIGNLLYVGALSGNGNSESLN